MDGFKTKLSSAGLVFKHFGREILRTILTETMNPSEVTDEFVDTCFIKVYRDFLEHVDGIDNGVTVAEGELRYHVSTTLSVIVIIIIIIIINRYL